MAPYRASAFAQSKQDSLFQNMIMPLRAVSPWINQQHRCYVAVEQGRIQDRSKRSVLNKFSMKALAKPASGQNWATDLEQGVGVFKSLRRSGKPRREKWQTALASDTWDGWALARQRRVMPSLWVSIRVTRLRAAYRWGASTRFGALSRGWRWPSSTGPLDHDRLLDLR